MMTKWLPKVVNGFILATFVIASFFTCLTHVEAAEGISGSGETTLVAENESCCSDNTKIEEARVDTRAERMVSAFQIFSPEILPSIEYVHVPFLQQPNWLLRRYFSLPIVSQDLSVGLRP
jgi:hypothetical protein